MDLSVFMPHLEQLAVVVITGFASWALRELSRWLSAKSGVQVEQRIMLAKDRIQSAATNAVRYAFDKAEELGLTEINITLPDNPVKKYALEYMKNLMLETLQKNQLTDADVEAIIATKMAAVRAEREAQKAGVPTRFVGGSLELPLP